MIHSDIPEYISCVLGAQYAQQVFVVLAFLAGVVISMYPIDVLAGDILCGPYPCSADAPPSEFCGWAASRVTKESRREERRGGQATCARPKRQACQSSFALYAIISGSQMPAGLVAGLIAASAAVKMFEIGLVAVGSSSSHHTLSLLSCSPVC